MSHYPELNKKVLAGVNLPMLIVLVAVISACAGKPLNQINLMPAPDIYDDGTIDPFLGIDPEIKPPYEGILYATDRKPSSKDDHFYDNKRGSVLRLGIGNVQLGIADMTWEEAREISLAKNRSEAYPLKISDAEEFGVLNVELSKFIDPALVSQWPDEPGKRFAQKVNDKLTVSKRKDIYIYVHGYKVVFENPLLVATELWHFLGYDGAFIAYAWPSTPDRWAYASDLETASLSAHNLRIFLDYLAENTHAENIHIIGYSAGTRVVINALAQIALLHAGDDSETIQNAFRIGHVILVGSDYDRQLFGTHMINGLLNVPKTLSVYMSERDKALSISRWLFRRDRLGQKWDKGKLHPDVKAYLYRTPNLAFIDVTDIEGATSGNGHAYFRKSPWASSDILITLMYDLRPAQRGLVREPDRPIWTFPPDYMDELRAVLRNENPELIREPVEETTNK